MGVAPALFTTPPAGVCAVVTVGLGVTAMALAGFESTGGSGRAIGVGCERAESARVTVFFHRFFSFSRDEDNFMFFFSTFVSFLKALSRSAACFFSSVSCLLTDRMFLSALAFWCFTAALETFSLSCKAVTFLFVAISSRARFASSLDFVFTRARLVTLDSFGLRLYM